ncbi:MAG: TIM barrel protein, partial [Thermoplasmata archaeon]|nr:TIM barrel protein [Thermoplasmata archaeon]
MFSLSTVWGISKTKSGDELIREAHELGFRFVELHHSLKATTVREIQKLEGKGVIKISSLHNFCPAVQNVGSNRIVVDPFSLSSLDRAERTSAVKNTVKTLELAKLLGAPAIVLHCGKVEMEDFMPDLIEMYGENEKGLKAYGRRKTRGLLKRERKARPYLEALYRSLDELVEKSSNVRIG